MPSFDSTQDGALSEVERAPPGRAATRPRPSFTRLWPLIVAAALWLCGWLGWMAGPELKALDALFTYRGTQRPHPAIRLIAIDDASLAQIGRWPWPRQHHADFIDALQDARFRPRVLGYDVLFTEPQAENLQYDADLGRATRQAGNLCHAYFFTMHADASSPPSVETPEALARWALGSPPEALRAPLTAQRVTLPIADLRQGARLGYVDVEPDADGVTRRLPLVIAYQGRLYPAFSLQLACAYWGVEPQRLQVTRGPWGPRLEIPRSHGGPLHVPLDERGHLLINYVGDLADFQAVAMVHVIGWMGTVYQGGEAAAPLAGLRDGITLIGASAIGMGDVKVTPFAVNTRGFLVHANALDNLLSGRFIHRAPGWMTALLVLLIALLLGEAATRFPPLRAALICLTLLTAYAGVCLISFMHLDLWLELVQPMLAGGATFLGITIYRFSKEEREKRWVRQAFGRFVSPKILEEVLQHPEKLHLGGERRELTVLFSDVRGFTTFSEKHSPEEVVEMLNKLLDRLTTEILRHEGTLDKYVGDAIMAIFGAPGEMGNAEHARHACAAALDMVQALRQLQEEWRAKGQEVLDIGIGINTGPMVVGNMGSTQVMGYTVIGDAVNLGARVEGLTRQHQCAIVITESTYELVKDVFDAERIGGVHVKGKEQEVVVYKLLGARTAAVAA